MYNFESLPWIVPAHGLVQALTCITKITTIDDCSVFYKIQILFISNFNFEIECATYLYYFGMSHF
jgi:hypothetical protein